MRLTCVPSHKTTITKEGGDNIIGTYDYQDIKFNDGVEGRLFQEKRTKRYYVSHGLATDYYYKDFTSAVKALYIYKKYGKACRKSCTNCW